VITVSTESGARMSDIDDDARTGGFSAKADLSRKSIPAMWSGSLTARSTGMGLR
jgi:hypothetical protein